MADPNEPTDPESFATEMPLTDVFGNHPKTLLLGALLTESPEPATHFSVSELARITGLEESTAESHVADLAETDLVVETDELEETPTYVLDEDTAVGEAIRRVHDELYDAGAT